ncbi:ATP-dependent helicase [Bacillus sp. FJAT-44742]|uniref:ATP-dependent helicase n=1 Tax=Bacillus sp. FJAT-44742 TaxID=2014005 RepID=UPI000C24CAF3|nr:ATP-dependent helicase [Bacillus sp. FJAT-44742]
MKVALFQEQLIHTEKVDRYHWQRVVSSASKGQVLCPVCRAPIHAKVGIHHPLSFHHPGDDSFCLSEAEKLAEHIQTKDTSPKENNGFELPKSRSISEGTTEENSTHLWRRPLWVTVPTECSLSQRKEPTGDLYKQFLDRHNLSLTQPQWEAVHTTNGPLLILAGAGSGKTRVLTARTAYMLTTEEIPPNRLALITFTVKAAKEMKRRLQTLPGLGHINLSGLLAGTFHSIFYKMLIHHEKEKWQQHRLLKENWKQEGILKEKGKELGLDDRSFAYDQALLQISQWKNQGKSPQEIESADPFEEQTLSLFSYYEEVKEQKGLFDFDDMQTGCLKMLQSNPELLERYQERFKYLLIDEYQDINPIQYEIVQLLTARYRNLCVVGDDDQSIYGFRGSDPSFILRFTDNFPEAKTVTLEDNYRSTSPIITLANQVITNNQARHEKEMKSIEPAGHSPLLYYPLNEEEEATATVTDIKQQLEQGSSPNDFAVLYRTHSAGRALFERLLESNVPFTSYGNQEAFYLKKHIRKALAYLRLSINPDDGNAVRELMSALFIKQSAYNDARVLSINEDITLLEALPLLSGLQDFQRTKLKKIIPKIPSLKKKEPIEALKILQQDLGLKEYVKKNGKEGNKLERGSDDIKDLETAARRHDTVSSFLEHADHMTAQCELMKKEDEPPQAVKIMTIHQSKGLEFENVYILGAVEGGLPHDHSLEMLREGKSSYLEEERRLMYVALTRAKKKIAISVPQYRRESKARASRFIKELRGQKHLPSTHKTIKAGHP